MITLFAFLLLIIGSANWLTIGLLQFDFVAGLFGSQSNIFSRIVYVLIGIGAIITTVNVIKNKGKLVFNFRKLKLKKQDPVMQTEQGKDMSMQSQGNYNTHQQENISQPQQFASTIQPQNNFQHEVNNQNSNQNKQIYNDNYPQHFNQNHAQNTNNFNTDTPHAQNSPYENNWQTTQPPEEPRNNQRFSNEAGMDFNKDLRSISNRLSERHNQNKNNL